MASIEMLININVNTPQDYANTAESSPILSFAEGVEVDLSKFASEGYAFVAGDVVDNKTYVYMSIYACLYVYIHV